MADRLLDLQAREFGDLAPRRGYEISLRPIDVNRRGPAGGQGIGLLGAEIHRFDFEQDVGDDAALSLLAGAARR